MKRTSRGFTLIELIVVLAIIGILSALLIPQLFGYIKDSKLDMANKNAETVLRTFSTEVSMLLADGTSVKDGIYGFDGTGKTSPTASVDIVGSTQKELDSSFAKAPWMVVVVSGNAIAAYYAKTTSDKMIGAAPESLHAKGNCDSSFNSMPDINYVIKRGKTFDSNTTVAILYPPEKIFY